MQLAPTNVRVMAFALAAVIASALFATIVTSMPPDFGGPNDARNASGERIEVVIVPSRIEVVGEREALTAADGDATLPVPRS
jgi:hypothetical protein